MDKPTPSSFSETAKTILADKLGHSFAQDDDARILQALTTAHNADVQAARVEELTRLRPMSGFQKSWYTGGKTGDAYWSGIGRYERDVALDKEINRRLSQLQGDTNMESKPTPELLARCKSCYHWYRAHREHGWCDNVHDGDGSHCPCYEFVPIEPRGGK